jgi:glycerol-3-phosphate acyltransferase PlsY
MAVFIVFFGYLLGSIPTAYIAGRLIKGGDIRQMGDGNVGAQNAFHQLGAAAGYSVFLLDAIKGALAILLAYAAGLSQPVILFTGTAAVVGHNWPVFLGFRGGRGESTSIGVLAVLAPLPILIAGSLSIAILIKTRSIIKASFALFVPLPLLCWWFSLPGILVVYSIWLPGLVGITHFIRTRQRLVRAA